MFRKESYGSKKNLTFVRFFVLLVEELKTLVKLVIRVATSTINHKISLLSGIIFLVHGGRCRANIQKSNFGQVNGANSVIAFMKAVIKLRHCKNPIMPRNRRTDHRKVVQRVSVVVQALGKNILNIARQLVVVNPRHGYIL